MRLQTLPGPTLIVVDGQNLSYHVPRYDPYDGECRRLHAECMYRAFSLLSTEAGGTPARIVVTWDSGLARWRKELFPGYKGQRAAARDSMDDESRMINEQRVDDVRLMRAVVLPLLGIDQVYCDEPAEADDLIYSVIADYTSRESYSSVLIVSSDGDLDQLVTPRSDPSVGAYPASGNRPSVYRIAPSNLSNMNGRDMPLIDGSLVHKRYRVWPEDIVLYKAITGDQSDNIPGVGGIAEKTLEKIIAEYGTLPNFISRGAKSLASTSLPPRVSGCFTGEGMETIKRNLHLMDLRKPDVPIRIASGRRAAKLIEAVSCQQEAERELHRFNVRTGFNGYEIPVSGFVDLIMNGRL